MIRSACQQMSRAAAILAVALLCAQTLVVTHDHHLSDGVLCAVCSTPAEHAASPGLDTVDVVPIGTLNAPTRTLASPAPRAPSSQLARAPPIS